MLGWIVTRAPWLGRAFGWISGARGLWIAGAAIAALVGGQWLAIKLARSDAKTARAESAVVAGNLAACQDANRRIATTLDQIRQQSEKNKAAAQAAADRAKLAEARATDIDRMIADQAQAETLYRQERLTNDPECRAMASVPICPDLADDLRRRLREYAGAAGN